MVGQTSLTPLIVLFGFGIIEFRDIAHSVPYSKRNNNTLQCIIWPTQKTTDR